MTCDAEMKFSDLSRQSAISIEFATFYIVHSLLALGHCVDGYQ